MKLLTFLLIAGFTFPALAGRDGNGGHVVVCEDKEPIILDYYHAKLPMVSGEQPAVIKPGEERVDDWILHHLDEYYLSIGMTETALKTTDRTDFIWEFTDGIKYFPEVGTWIATSLNNTNDQNLAYDLPAGCKLLQAAVRQGESQYGDPEVIRGLSEGQKSILRIHEILYAMVIKANPAARDPSPIRELLRALLASENGRRVKNKAFSKFVEYLNEIKQENKQ